MLIPPMLECLVSEGVLTLKQKKKMLNTLKIVQKTKIFCLSFKKTA